METQKNPVAAPAAPSGRLTDDEFAHRAYGAYRSARGLSGNVETPAALRATFRVFAARYARFLPADRKARILEIGCGAGTFIAFLHSLGYENVEGVDASPEQVRLAHAQGRTRVAVGDNLEFLKQRAASADLVVALDVIEHYTRADLLVLLDQVNAALRPGGAFLVQTPNADGPFGTRHRYADFTHELSFTPNSLMQAMRLAGFRSVEFAAVEPVVHGVSSALRWLVWKAIRALLITYLAAETGLARGHILTQNMIARASK